MKNPNIKISDLVKLEGLEKPQERSSKVALSAKPEKVKALAEGMSDLAEKVEDQGEVKTGEVAELLESMKKALVKELAPEQAAKLLENLKKRFENKEKFYKSVEGVNWEEVQAKLEANPEKLWSLNEMERTGGEPDLMEYDKKTGEYIFMDCSTESPTGRRYCVYDRKGEEILKMDYPDEKYNSNAVSRAALMGVDLLNEKEYRDLQTKGEFDRKTWSWIKLPVDKEETGGALRGRRFGGGVRVSLDISSTHDDDGGFRASLRVK